MSDRPISATIVTSAALWLASIALATVYTVVGTRGTGVIAILLAAGGAVLTIRAFLCHLADDLIAREHTAFRLGQDVQRMKPVP